MLDQNITNLLSTLLGGLLTVAGGFLSNYYIQSSLNKTNKKKEIRNMIESAYKDIQALDVIFRQLKNLHPQTVTNDDLNSLVEETNKIMQHLEMIISLYLYPINTETIKYLDNISANLQLSISFLSNNEFYKISDLSYESANIKGALQKLLIKEGYAYF